MPQAKIGLIGESIVRAYDMGKEVGK